MSDFDFMNFTNGLDYQFVAHANKYTEEEAIDICVFENYKFEHMLRIPTINDIKARTVKYFVKCPEYCGLDTDGGCYTFCDKGTRGSFPVWVIEFNDLKT